MEKSIEQIRKEQSDGIRAYWAEVKAGKRIHPSQDPYQHCRDANGRVLRDADGHPLIDKLDRRDRIRKRGREKQRARRAKRRGIELQSGMVFRRGRPKKVRPVVESALDVETLTGEST